MFDKKPALIARCSGTADVIDAVNFARENEMLTAVRCGSHNSSGSGSVRRRYPDRSVGNERGARQSQDKARPGSRRSYLG